jgi:RNA-binding protein YlmH
MSDGKEHASVVSNRIAKSYSYEVAEEDMVVGEGKGKGTAGRTTTTTTTTMMLPI